MNVFIVIFSDPVMGRPVGPFMLGNFILFDGGEYMFSGCWTFESYLFELCFGTSSWSRAFGDFCFDSRVRVCRVRM